MHRYTNAELADIHYTYGRANGNSSAAQRIYQETYPQRQCPAKDTFRTIHRRLAETGSFLPNTADWGRERYVRTPDIEERVLDMIAQDPGTSTRQIASAVGVSHQSVWRVLRHNLLYPYHVQRVQALSSADYPPRVMFCEWYLQRCIDPTFQQRVFFTDEATFTRDAIVNYHNNQWADVNPHAITQSRYQQQFSWNVWAGIIGDYLIGPVFLPPRLNAPNYRNFLENELPPLLEDIPLGTRQQLWFMHDGAPAHFSLTAREFLNQHYPGRWIGRGGPTAWPPRSPDLNPLDFFVWGYLKSLVYATPVPDRQALRDRIVDGCNTIRGTPGILEHIRQSMVRRCGACITAHGGHFEHLI